MASWQLVDVTVVVIIIEVVIVVASLVDVAALVAADVVTSPSAVVVFGAAAEVDVLQSMASQQPRNVPPEFGQQSP